MSNTSSASPSPGSIVRALLKRDRMLVTAGVYDGLTAKLVERAGFEAVYLTGAGVSYMSLARGDLGFIGLGEMVEHARQLVRAVSIPVLADADTGYGNVVNVVYTVQEFERAGVAGIQLEDQPLPKKCAYYAGLQVVPIEEMVGKLRAACDARRDPSFLIIARTDSKAAIGIDEAVRRVKAYEAAGADIVFVESVETIEEMRAVTQAVSVPAMVSMVEGSPTPLLRVEELQAAGYRLVLYPNSVARAVAFAAAGVLATIRAEGTTKNYLHRMMSYPQLSELVGVPEDGRLEAKYSGFPSGRV